MSTMHVLDPMKLKAGVEERKAEKLVEKFWQNEGILHHKFIIQLYDGVH